jgi:hypothetical protein
MGQIKQTIFTKIIQIVNNFIQTLHFIINITNICDILHKNNKNKSKMFIYY